MAQEEEKNGGLEVKTQWGSVSGKKVAEFITILSLCVMGIIGYAFWEHKLDAKASGESLTATMKDMAQAIREGNCINSYPEAERENKVEFCKRVTR